MKMSRKEVIEILEVQISSAEFVAMYTHNDRDAEKELKNAEAFRMAIEALKAYRPQGEWIVEYTDANRDKWYRCSHCGERFVLIEKGEASIEPYHFCPNCGAQMKGADDE